MSEERRPSDPRADDLRRRYYAAFGLADEIPVPVEAIAVDLLGLWVEEVEALPVSGVLIPAERTVLINHDESLVRRRFTLAHEVGHWICQCDEGRAPAPAIMCRSTDLSDPDRQLEREANIFAADLLMPEADIRDGAHVPAHVLAGRFAVSEPAMAWRLYNFALGPRPDASAEPSQ